MGFLGGFDSKEFTFSGGDPSLIPGSRRSPRQDSYLENRTNRGAWLATVYGATK